MKKLIFGVLLMLSVNSLYGADIYKTIYNPFSSKMDYVNLTISSANWAATSGTPLDLISSSWWNLDSNNWLVMNTTSTVDSYWSLDSEGWLTMLPSVNGLGHLQYTPYELDIDTDTHINGMIRQNDTWHVFGGTQEVNIDIPLTANVWKKITNSTGNLWSALEYDGFSMMSDSMIIANVGDYFGNLSITFGGYSSGNNNDEYEIRIYNVTSGQQAGFLTGASASGNSNFAIITKPIYIENAVANSVYILQARNISGSHDMYLRNATFYIAYLHD